MSTESRAASAVTPAYSADLASFCAGLQFGAIPDGVLAHLKLCIADTLACGVFGSTLPWSRDVLEMCRSLNRDGAAGAWGTSDLLGPDLAALVNGAQVHSFEFDDLHRRAIVHPGGVTIPALAAWAAAQPGRAVSGRQFLTAAAAGYEACIRIGLATGMGLMRRGWHNNAVVGTFGGAAAVGRAMGLDAHAMEDALSMAATQSGGLMAAQYGSSVKRLHAGRAAQSGLYAALLADRGYRGIDEVLEAPYGGFAATFTDSFDLAEVTRGLGEEWELVGVGFKPYPACGSSHTGIDAALAIRAAGAEPAQVRGIRIGVSTATLEHVGWAYTPDTVTTAQMSLRFAVATALVHGEVTVESFRPDRLAEPAVLAVADKIEVHADPEADAGGRDSRHAIVMDISLADGQVISRSVRYAKGSEMLPLAESEVRAKCLALLTPVLGADRASAIWDKISRLEEAADIGAELLALLRPDEPR